MIKIKDYSINEDVYKGLRFTIFRGIRDYDGKHVIIKIPHVDQFNSSDFSLLKHEYEITKQIDSKFVINILEFNTGETPFLVFEDFGGISLRNFLRKGKLSPRLAIRLAIRLFKGLGDIHNSNIIHKDIKPENIILNFRTSEVRITDFGISTILENENGEIKNPEKLEGSLAYISPEQTGRMNRLLDYRTDYYSMGIVLYEMLTGRLPFGSKDPMELIHSHLAKIPKSPEELQEDIPEILSAIVMKLISKSAEDRYKTSKGIIFDLNECLNQLKILNRIQKFELGSKDISPRFQIPKKLYGRDKQIRLLLDSYDKSSNGTPLFLLVGGYSGMGKSVLVNEIQRPVVEKRGYFISGKYDQFQRDIPYYAIIHAFRDLCRQILTESVSAIQIWKNRILQALEPNTAVITEVIHELEFIVGNVNPVVDLPPVEAQNRFEDSFLNFIKLFATTKSPIALFLDDLQWADLSSLNLLKVLLTELHQGSLLIIGAYRDNEVDIHHPLLNLLGDLKKEKISPIELNLKPLDLENVNALISDTLAQNTGKTKELAELIELKTGGNPFFVGEFISNLYKKSLIKFNRDKAIWEWDIDVLRKQQTTDNVVDLVMGRILELPSSQQEVLKLAACLGSTFSFGELKIVSIKEQKELADLIWNILPMGVLESVGNSGSKLQSFIYQLENENEIKEINNLEFSFLHDRIQQAAYQLISEDDRIRTHYKIGKYLLENYKISQLREKDESLSNLISHLNKAISITKSIEEKEELAKLNSIVAGKAENSAAFTSAYYYLNIAISLLPPNSWNSSYEFTFDLFLRKAQCSYIIGSFDESETLFSEIIKNAKSNLDKGRVYEIKVVQYANQNHLVKAVDTGLEGLKLFGFNLPRSPSLPRVLVEVIFAWKAQGKRKTKDLLNLPEVKDAETLMVARLLNHLTSPSYGTNQNLFALVVVKGVILALKKGVNESSAYMFGLYAALVGSKLLLFKAGEEYGHLAINLSLRFSNLRQRCRSHFAMGTFVYGWTRHVRDSFTYSLEAFRLARETGDNIYSAYSIVEYCDKLMFLGKDLKSTQEEVGKYTHYVVEQIQDRWIGTLMLAMNQSLLNLLGKTNSKETLSDGFFNEEDYTREINQEGEGQMDWYHTNKSKILYLYGDYDKALEMAKKAEEKMVYSFATMLSGEHNFYHSLILCALINKYPGRKRKYLFQIWLNNLFLKIWAGANKENFLHRTLLVDAEVARIKKQYEKAEILYNRAIEEAKKAGYLQNEALANELAGKYYADRDLIKSARSYILDAYSGYERWGAVHKIKIMENDWMGKVGLSLRSGVNSNYMKTITERNTTDISGTSSTSMILDIFSIMKSSQAISEEIKVSSLLEKMLNILIENAGAEKGVFLVNRNNGLFIEAKMDSGSEKIDSGLKIPLEKFEELPISIINYVLRTRENLVIADASVSPLFKMDPFIINKKIKSIFCMPVLYQAKLFGILYLENNLATDAFSESRAEIVNLLSSQISISLNNAILYSDMEEMAKSFSRFVPGQFLEFLGKKNIQEISAGDAMPHKMTILFSDIRDFTNISEKMDVKDNFGFLNSYMKRMEPIIKKNEGFIDKFIGDAIMALFPNSPETGIKTIIDMKKELFRFNEYRKSKGFLPIKIGIGLHTGNLILGTLGSVDRMETTVIGDSVNLASRLEGITKQMGVQAIVSEMVLRTLPSDNDYDYREIGSVHVKGKEMPIKIYELIDGDPEDIIDKKLEILQRFSLAMYLFQERYFQSAMSIFKKILTILPNDIPTIRYIKSCENFIENPPPSNWDGWLDNRS